MQWKIITFGILASLRTRPIIAVCSAKVFTAQPDMRVSDRTRMTSGDTSVSTCESICAVDNACIGFDYTGGGSCYVITNPDIPVTADPSSTHYRGSRTCITGSIACVYELFGAYATNGGATFIPFAYDNCVSFCNNNNLVGCTLLAYDYGTNTCMLSSGVDSEKTANATFEMMRKTSCQDPALTTTQGPTLAPEPTSTPEPTPTLGQIPTTRPTPTPEPTSTPEPTPTPTPGPTPTQTFVRDPVFTSASPTFGPVAGGTNITVTGRDFFVPADRLFLGPENRLECFIVFSNSTMAIGVTPPSNVTDVDLTISIKFAGAEEPYPLNEAFVYKPNPAVERIQPLEAILQGGTTLSVSGSSLDSVSNPSLEITMVAIRQVRNNINETRRLFEQVCAVSTAETLLCETPEIDLPDEIRDAINITQQEDAINYNLRGNISLTFYLGLKLDGFEAYKNISANADLSEYGTIDVYIAGDTLISSLKDRIVYNGEPIKIKGQRMTSGLRLGDYSVDIGLGRCRVESLSSSALVCTPPSTEPDKLPQRNSRYHLIKVHAGSVLEYEYGEIYYKPGNWIWLVIGCVGGTVIIVIIIVTTVCLLRRKKRHTNRQPTTIDTNQNGDSMIYLPPVEKADSNDLPDPRPPIS